MNTIREVPGGISFPIAVSRNNWLDTGIVFTGMPIAVYGLLLSTRYDNIPLGAWWILGPILLLFVCGFGLFLCNGLGMLLYCVGRIELTREEIRVKVGPLTIRKLETGRIKTVVYTEQGFGKHSFSYHGMLVLSTETVGAIERKGKRKIDREGTLWKDLTDRGMKLGRLETAAYACYYDKLPWLVLGSRKGLAFGYTEERKKVLQHYLYCARFVA